jgi:hypothetical protein
MKSGISAPNLPKKQTNSETSNQFILSAPLPSPNHRADFHTRTDESKKTTFES